MSKNAAKDNYKLILLNNTYTQFNYENSCFLKHISFFYAEIKEKLIDSGECEMKSKMKIYSLSSFKTYEIFTSKY